MSSLRRAAGSTTNVLSTVPWLPFTDHVTPPRQTYTPKTSARQANVPTPIWTECTLNHSHLAATPLHHPLNFHLAVHPHQPPPQADICAHTDRLRTEWAWPNLATSPACPSVWSPPEPAHQDSLPHEGGGGGSRGQCVGCCVGYATVPQKFHSAYVGRRTDGSPTTGACQLVCPTSPMTRPTTIIQQTLGDAINM